MARIANTFVESEANINREELSNVISRITPEDTPIYSMIRKGSCRSVHPEWSIDNLDTPGQNAVTEGDEYTYDAITPAVRVGNYTQIMRKTLIVSGTQEKVSNAANAEKLKYQTLKRGVELRKDIEYMICSAQASVSGNDRRFGSLSTWLTSNTNRGATGADGGFKSADGFTDAPTNGTQRAFSKGLMDSLMQECYESGGNVKALVVSPYVKSVFVSFMSDTNVAAFRYNTKSGKGNSLVATVDMYEGPFGKVMIHPNRVMSVAALARNAFFIDPMMMMWCWLRRIKRENVAKTGDAYKRVLLGEGTLKVNNQAAHGVVADIFGISATS